MDLNDIYNRAQEAIAGAERSYGRIRSDQRLSADGQRVQMAAVYVRARDQLAELRQALDDGRATETRRLERTAFGPDREADRAAFRDATDRTDKLESSEDALALLGRAVRSGDTIQMQALAAWAVEHGDRSLLDALSEHLPERVAAARALSDHRAGKTGRRLEDSMQFSLPTPAELRDWENQVDQLAKLSTSS